DGLAQEVFDSLFGLGGLQRLIDEPEIENIDANGADVVWVRYADGSREQREPIAASDAELEALIRTAAARLGVSERRFDSASPRLSLQLPDGSRLFASWAAPSPPARACRCAATAT
ncbi:MAG: CpaF family protein, partial [Acidimicrobiales bacterium]